MLARSIAVRLRRCMAGRTGNFEFTDEPSTDFQFRECVLKHYSDVPAAVETFSFPNSSRTFRQAFGSFFVANGAPVSS
jgi:hypothetical protein